MDEAAELRLKNKSGLLNKDSHECVGSQGLGSDGPQRRRGALPKCLPWAIPVFTAVCFFGN